MTHYSSQVTKPLIGGSAMLFFGAVLIGAVLLGSPLSKPVGIGLGLFFLALGIYGVISGASLVHKPEGTVFYCRACKRLFSGALVACPTCGAIADPKAWWW